MSALYTGKSKAAPVHSIKAHGGSGGTAPLIRNLGTRWTEMVKFTSQPLYTRVKKTPNIHLNFSLGVPHSRFGRFGEEKFLTPPGTQPLDRPFHSRYHMNMHHLFQH